MSTNHASRNAGFAIAATLALLMLAPGATAVPVYDVQTGHDHDIRRVAAYCDLGGNWREIWEVHNYVAVGYWDNAGEWNEDYRYTHVPATQIRYAGACTDPGLIEFESIDLGGTGPAETQTAGDADEQVPVYDVRSFYSHDVRKLVGYCLGSFWYEVWEVHYYSSVGYWDNDGEWNEDYRTPHYSQVENRWAGYCSGIIDLEAPA